MPDPAVILLVEDDPNDALITHEFLRKAGINNRVVRVNDGWEAMSYLAGKAPFTNRLAWPLPALILLDLKLPKYDGFDVLTWLRSKPALAKLPRGCADRFHIPRGPQARQRTRRHRLRNQTG